MKDNKLAAENKLLQGEKLSGQTWISATFLLISVSLISKVLGLLREILIARNFGVGGEVDAYMVAITLPVLIGGVLGSSLGTSLIPLYQKTLCASGSDEGKNLIKSIISFTGIISGSLMLAMYLIPETLIKIIAPSLPGTTTRLAVELLKWLSFLVIGNSLFNVLSSVYNALHHFKIPAFTDLVSNLFVIFALIFFSSLWGIYALVMGLIVGVYFVVLVLTSNLLKLGIIGFRMEFNTREFKELINFAIPVLLYVFFPQLIGIIENFFASSLKEGSVSALGYAKRLSDALSTLLAVNIAKATFPTFSLLSSQRKIAELRDLVVKLNSQIVVYFLPLSFALVFFSKEIISFIFMRGAFDSAAVEMTSSVFIFYAAILCANMFVPTFFRLCYAFSDTTTPIKASLIGIVFVLPLYYFLTGSFGIMGIAFTSCIWVLITLLITGVSAGKKLRGLDMVGLGKTFVKSFLCASLAMLPFLGLESVNKFSIILTVPAYFLLYFILAWFVMNVEIRAAWKSFRRKEPKENIT